MGVWQDVSTGPLVCVSLALAVAVPWTTHRRLVRPSTLSEMYVTSRPGVVLGWLAVAIVALILVTAVLALFATRSPFLWSSVFMGLGACVALGETTVRYLRYDPTEDLAAQRIMSDDPASAAPESDG